MAARNALPNTSVQTVQEVIDYEVQVMSNTELPIVADGETAAAVRSRRIARFRNWNGEAPRSSCSRTQPGPRANTRQGCGDGAESRHVGRIKAAVDARRDQSTMIMARWRSTGEGIRRSRDARHPRGPL
jgi:hypothetical protein